MGIKGTVRRNQDGHFIHANIDLDIIITEETPIGILLYILRHFLCMARELGGLLMTTTVQLECNGVCLVFSQSYLLCL